MEAPTCSSCLTSLSRPCSLVPIILPALGDSLWIQSGELQADYLAIMNLVRTFLKISGFLRLFVQDSYWQQIILLYMYIVYVSKSKAHKVIFLSERGGFTILSSNILVTKNNEIHRPRVLFHLRVGDLLVLCSAVISGCCSRLTFAFKQLWFIFSYRMKCLHYCADFIVGLRGAHF